MGRLPPLTPVTAATCLLVRVLAKKKGARYSPPPPYRLPFLPSLYFLHVKLVSLQAKLVYFTCLVPLYQQCGLLSLNVRYGLSRVTDAIAISHLHLNLYDTTYRPWPNTAIMKAPACLDRLTELCSGFLKVCRTWITEGGES
jgi:hypothetical protein